MGAKSEISERILRAASERIRHFGYAKTTMAEIAADLRMSAGNLYRFFPSKLDIAEAMAQGMREREFNGLTEIVQRSDLSAREKLSLALQYRLKAVYGLALDQPRVVEIAEIIARERPDFVRERLREERLFIRTILEDGIRSGEFESFDNIEKISETIQCAITRYRMPHLWAQSTLEDMLTELQAVLDLLFRGLNRRSPTSP